MTNQNLIVGNQKNRHGHLKILKYVLLSMRPEQWIKNLFVFAALLFSKNVHNPSKVIEALIGFAIFCMITGCTYLVNDLIDLEKDRRHPVKSTRPIAAGKLRKKTVILVILLLGCISFFFAFSINKVFGIIVLCYFILNVNYSLYLKNIVIIDVAAIAAGFVLRVWGGAVIISVTASEWLFLCTILLSLFLGFSKRRHELVLLADNAISHRTVLEHYSAYYLDQMISVVAASTVICYALYTMSKTTAESLGTSKLIYTLPFVLYGIFRYLYLVHQKEKGGNPTDVMLTDGPMIVNVILWIISSFLFIYLVH
ncbi:MAG: decaprenyl-phosphate phosphoribosyltransferase [Candidatus Brocadia sp.]|jgi:4-hydroxybenzoate polyprenyltransferase|nr:Decaprenyl-phosphate phosphoribosyltransferase [Candidatus Brocadia fulgida]MCC6325503.1 decaprenyl-phosphate phosphoribosyltransferase [Candidatus Brocadia sp.]MCE7910216.1 decaprenyl-phosphate phosphoribosyltransferase [Candidatus Brocadia sp. AMX3]OQZ03182.1 MAG: decaprenyl-phosphate phosphoribosyltransferase [Candidatus Brocadia sp. UTAMX2]MDG5996821.1 decaprenyl-phosphate phosphoribosyltransferase [Candidatus Brocadia sp.]